MPAISLIVPVHNVEEYVAECLESILDQEFDDIEVIVVDDASPDGSARVIQDCIKGNDKVTFIRLEQNVGLGLARNEGLKVATGKYVMFVDSDDFIDREALRTIYDRLEATNADLVLFDYAKVHPTGEVLRNKKARLFQVDVPDTFDLHEHPELLSLLMVVWNKAYRRDFIERAGLTFDVGYYEDLPWTYPALMTAERISLLDRVCYYYRQRPSGNILRTSGSKHFDLFDQYSRVFAYIDAHPALEEWRPVLLRRMLQHLVFVLDQGETRIPDAERAAFITATSQLCDKVGANAEWPELTIEQRLLRRGSYRAFEALKTSEPFVTPVRKARTRLRAGSRRAGNRMVKRWKQRFRKAAYAVARRMPLDENLAVFYAYWGRGVACNPAAIYRKVNELKGDVAGVWIVSQQSVGLVPDGVDYVVPQSLRYYLTIARATYFVGNIGFPSDWVKREGQLQVMTHHGTTLKSMGLDLKQFPVAARNLNFDQHMKRVSRWDFSVASSSYSDGVWRRAYPGSYESLPFGQPRNDLFFTATHDDQRRMRAELGIPDDKIAILYAPTFRDWERDDEVQLDLERFTEQIGPEYVVMARSHYYRRAAAGMTKFAESAVIDVSEYPDVQPLCLAADILLTDYSSIQFDYAILGRPVVIYAHDWDLYLKLRGTYFDLLGEAPGAVATTEQELIEVIRSREYESQAARQKLAAFRDRFCEFEDGRAAERVVRRVFLGERPVDLLPAGKPPMPTIAPDPLGTVTQRPAPAEQSA